MHVYMHKIYNDIPISLNKNKRKRIKSSKTRKSPPTTFPSLLRITLQSSRSGIPERWRDPPPLLSIPKDPRKVWPKAPRSSSKFMETILIKDFPPLSRYFCFIPSALLGRKEAGYWNVMIVCCFRNIYAQRVCIRAIHKSLWCPERLPRRRWPHRS